MVQGVQRQTQPHQSADQPARGNLPRRHRAAARQTVHTRRHAHPAKHEARPPGGGGGALMIATNTITLAHADALLKATQSEHRTDVQPVERKRKTALIEQIEKFEPEIRHAPDSNSLAEKNYGSDQLNLLAAKGYHTKLLVSETVKSNIGSPEPEILPP